MQLFGGAGNGSQEDYPCIRMAQEGASGVMSLLVEGLSLMDGSGTLVASMYWETLWKSLVVKPCHTPKEVCNVGRVHEHKGNHDLWVKWYKLYRVSNYHDSHAHGQERPRILTRLVGYGLEWLGWLDDSDLVRIVPCGLRDGMTPPTN